MFAMRNKEPISYASIRQTRDSKETNCGEEKEDEITSQEPGELEAL